MKTEPKLAKTNFPPLLSLTYLLQQSADEILLKEARVSLSHARILSALNTSPVTQKSVASVLHQTEANVSRQLKVMKRAGLVSITKNKKDGRVRDVSLTRKGSERKTKAQKILAKQQRDFLKSMSRSEADTLAFTVQRLAGQL